MLKLGDWWQSQLGHILGIIVMTLPAWLKYESCCTKHWETLFDLCNFVNICKDSILPFLAESEKMDCSDDVNLDAVPCEGVAFLSVLKFIQLLLL